MKTSYYKRNLGNLVCLLLLLFSTGAIAQVDCGAFIKFGQQPTDIALRDIFGNFYSSSEIKAPDTTQGGGSRGLSATCGCSDVGINTAYFDLYFEDCDFSTNVGFADPTPITNSNPLLTTKGKLARKTVCQVYKELSDLIMQNSSCGSAQKVIVQIRPSVAVPQYYGSSGNATNDDLPAMAANLGGIASPYMSPSVTGLKDGLPWIVINSGVQQIIPNTPPQFFHGFMRFNFNAGTNWNLDDALLPTSTQYDLRTVVFHEALHMLGFGSLLQDDGTTKLNPGLVSNPNRQGGFSRFDSYLAIINDIGGIPNNTTVIVNNPLNSLTWKFNAPTLTAPSSIQSSCMTSPTGPDMIFKGSSGSYPIYSGSTYVSSSSYSHLVANCNNPTPDYVMQYQLPTGTRQSITVDEIHILCDIGYKLNATYSQGVVCNCSVGGSDDTKKGCTGAALTTGQCTPLTFTVTDIIANDPNATGIFSYGIDNPLFGSITLSGSTFTFTPLQAGQADIWYIPIGCSGKTGNVAHILINVSGDKTCPNFCRQPINQSPFTVSGHTFLSPYKTSTNCNYQENPCNLVCNGQICGTQYNDIANPQVNEPNEFNYYVAAYPGYNDVPGWINTNGTCDYFTKSITSVTPGNGYFRMATGEGLKTELTLSVGNYLSSIYTAKYDATSSSIGKFKMYVVQSSGTPVGRNALPFNYTGIAKIPIVNHTVSNNAPFLRHGSCFNVNNNLYDAIWIYADDPSCQYAFDQIEVVKDEFTAGADQVVSLCGNTAYLGGKFCMLSDVEIEYKWFISGNASPISTYRVKNGTLTSISGIIPDATTFKIQVNPLIPTTYRLERTITNYGGIPTTELILCATSDEVFINVNDPQVDASFQSIVNCNSVQNNWTPAYSFTGAAHDWNFGDGTAHDITANPVHIYTLSGTYTVSHTVTNNCGAQTKTNNVVINIPAAPTVTTPVSYCLGATASPLTATGTALKWYSAATGGIGNATPPTPVTTSVGSTNYYVSQTTNGCESTRASIIVTVISTPAPSVTTPVSYCLGATATALTASGTALKWYTVATGGTGSTTAPTPVTTTAGSTTYYVSQTTNGCESPRASIVVTVYPIPVAPSVTTPVSYCLGATATALTASGTALKWYTVATGGTGSTTAPTPVTTTAGSTTYYVSQTTNGCESPRASIVVTVYPIPVAPTVTTPVSYCQGVAATALTATGTALKWYTVATGGTGSTTAPTPVTTTAGSTTYYVSQTTNGCESPRASIIVTVISTPAPAVTTPVSYCLGATATALNATGTALKWYTVATGGTGSTTAPTPVTTTAGSTTYYVSQTTNGCESPRASIVVTVYPIPVAPSVTTPVSYCLGATATALTASGTALKWYTVATGGTGSTTAPTPVTTTAGFTTYYVSQTTNGCESPRASIVVTVNSVTASSTQTTISCNGGSNATATVTASGGTAPYTYLWSTVPVQTTATATNLSLGSYTVTTTDNKGCTAVNTAVINYDASCCQSNAPIGTIKTALTVGTDMTSSQLFAQFATVLSASYVYTASGLQTINNVPYKISINSVITLDQDLDLRYVDIAFGPNGTIVTNGKYLHITYSTLYACSPQMWKGIQVNGNNGVLEFKKNQIRDAENGIVLANNASADIQDCEFINNFKGIYIDGGGFLLLAHGPTSFNLQKCKFTTEISGGNIPAHVPLQTSVIGGYPLKATALNTLGGTLGYCGLDIINVQPSNAPLQIGVLPAIPNPTNPGMDANTNEFRKLYCGIKGTSSRYKIVNSSFYIPVSSPTANAASALYGCGVYNTNTPTFPMFYFGYKAFELVMGETGYTNCNYFETARIGVYHNGFGGITLNGNWFLGFEQAVSINNNNNVQGQFGRAYNVSILNNTFHFSSLLAVAINGCTGTGVEILNNNFTSYTSAQTTALRRGIYINNVLSTDGTYNTVIQNNTIRGKHIAIDLLNAHYTSIQHNGIRLGTEAYSPLPNSWMGIQALNSNNLSVANNYYDLAAYVTTTPAYVPPVNPLTSGVDGRLIGIELVNCDGASISCESINNYHWGIAVAGPSVATKPFLIYNHFGNTEVGIVIHKNGALGFTGGPFFSSYLTADNNWDIGWNQYHLGVFDASGVGQTFYLRNNPGMLGWSAIYNPLISGSPLGIRQQKTLNSPFFPTPITVTSVNTLNDCSTTGYISSRIAPPASGGSSAVLEASEKATLIATTAWESPEELQWAAATDITQELAAQLSERKQKLAQQRSLWATQEAELADMVQGTAAYTDLETDYRKWDKNELYNALLAHPEMKDSLPFLQDFTGTFESAGDYAALLKVYKAMTESKFGKAGIDTLLQAEWEQKIQASIPAERQATNLKTIATAELEFTKNESKGLSEQNLANIKELAAKCMVTDGEAVLLARSLYYRATGDLGTQFRDWCISQTGFYKTDETNTTTQSRTDLGNFNFVVYPNPVASGEQILVETDKQGTITVTNAIGQLIEKRELQMGINYILKGNIYFSAGIYCYKYVSLDGGIISGKFIIK